MIGIAVVFEISFEILVNFFKLLELRVVLYRAVFTYRIGISGTLGSVRVFVFARYVLDDTVGLDGIDSGEREAVDDVRGLGITENALDGISRLVGHPVAAGVEISYIGLAFLLRFAVCKRHRSEGVICGVIPRRNVVYPVFAFFGALLRQFVYPFRFQLVVVTHGVHFVIARSSVVYHIGQYRDIHFCAAGRIFIRIIVLVFLTAYQRERRRASKNNDEKDYD